MGFADNRYMFDTGHWKKITSNPEPEGKPILHPANKIGDERSFTTDWLTDRAIEFIEEQHGEPFCFMVSFPDPHGPDRVREPYYSMYKDKDFERPYTGDNDPATAPAWGKPLSMDNRGMKNANNAAYYGMVKCIDDNVGRMLKKLDELGLTDRTMIVEISIIIVSIE